MVRVGLDREDSLLAIRAARRHDSVAALRHARLFSEERIEAMTVAARSAVPPLVLISSLFLKGHVHGDNFSLCHARRHLDCYFVASIH
jgi:hypothetical protein